MNPIQLMKINETNFTKQEVIIMNTVIERIESLTNLSLVEFADKVGISKSALLRFVQKLGYEGYSQFKYDVSRYVDELDTGGLEHPNQKTISEIYAETILAIDNVISEEDMNNFYTKIVNAKNIKIFGYAETGISASYLSERLLAYGYDSEAVSQVFNIHKKVAVSEPDDLLIIISISGNTAIIGEVINQAEQRDLNTVLITQNTFSMFRNRVKQSIFVPYFTDTNDAIKLDSHVILYAFFSKFINYLISETEKE